jgi:hypothetical protein
MKLFFTILLAAAAIAMIAAFIFLDMAPQPAGLVDRVDRMSGSGAGTIAEPSFGDDGDSGDDKAGSVGRMTQTDVPSVTQAERNSSTQIDPSSELPNESASVMTSDQQTRRFIRSVTVEIENRTEQTAGLGVVIAVGARTADILTANHVLEVAQGQGQPLELEVRWQSAGGDEDRSTGEGGIPNKDSSVGLLSSLGPPSYRSVRILRLDPASDLAVIRVDMPGGADFVRPAPIYPGDVGSLAMLVGQKAWTIERSDSEAVVATAQIESMEVARTSAGASPNAYLCIENPSELGMSGGGLFLSPRAGGDPVLIGIASGNSDRRGFYVAAHVIAELLRKVRVSGL